MAESGGTGAFSPADSAWDAGLQVQIVELNVQVLEAVRQRAGAGDGAPQPLLRELAPLWNTLDDSRLQALARCPYLMLDAGFSRPDLWDAGVHETAPPAHWLAAVLPPELVRRAVMLGWHLARTNPFAARITLGMSPQCAQLIGRTRLRDLELLVERRAPSCRLRWEDRIAVWQQLLQAALAGPVGTLQVLQLRGVQLLAAEDAPTAARSRST